MRFVYMFLALLALGVGSLATAQSSSELLRRARLGDVTAMRKVGIRLFEGNGAPKNIPGAIAWWEKAAQRGDVRALVYLGDMHRQGIYYAQNLQKAAELYAIAASQGDAVAQKHLNKLPATCKTPAVQVSPAPCCPQATAPATPAFLDTLNAEHRSNVQWVYEHEVVLEDSPEAPYRTYIRGLARDLYKKHNGHRQKIMHDLYKGAALGIRLFNGQYVIENTHNTSGPFCQCLEKAAQHIQYSGLGDLYAPINDIRFCELSRQWDKSPCKGLYSDAQGRKFHYTVTVTPDQEGYPHTVKIRLDFTPARANIIKK